MFGIKFRHELPEGFKRAFWYRTGADNTSESRYRFHWTPVHRQCCSPGRVDIRSGNRAGRSISTARVKTREVRSSGEHYKLRHWALLVFSFFKVAQHFDVPRLQQQLTREDVFNSYANVMRVKPRKPQRRSSMNETSQKCRGVWRRCSSRQSHRIQKPKELKQRLLVLFGKAIANAREPLRREIQKRSVPADQKLIEGVCCPARGL